MSTARPLVAARDRRILAACVFVLAFVVRALWTLRVQSPLAAVYSDMGGYVSRADALLAGIMPEEPRILALWPWGTHALLALEFFVLGRHAAVAIALCHSFVGALAAPCATLLAARFVPSRFAIAAAGVLVALWQPHVLYSGFFSSEIWFSAAISIGTWLFVRRSEGRAGRLGAGLALAVAFVVRPQVLLTAILAGVMLVTFALARGIYRPRRGWFVVLLPLALAIAASSARLHTLTGHFGLISSNAAAQRVFGETSVGKIEAEWTAPGGARWTWWFAPHTKLPVAPSDVVRVRGFITDPDLMARLRAERLRGVSWAQRIARMAKNVSLLAAGNRAWPEDDFRADPFRARLQDVFAQLFFFVLALAVPGLVLLFRRHRVAAVLVLANLATIVIVPAFYLGEVRFRVPYDPLILVAAVVCAYEVVQRAKGALARRRASAPAEMPASVTTT